MPKIRFEDGTIVNVSGTPTPQDVDYIAKQLNIKPKTPSFTERITGDAISRGSEVLSTGKELLTGKITGREAKVSVAGQAAGFVNDVFGEVISPLLKPAIEPLLKTPIGQQVVMGIQRGREVYDSMKQKSPEFGRAAKELEAIVNISMLFPGGKGASVAGAGAKQGVKEGASVAGNLLEKTGQVAQGLTPIFKPTLKEAGQIIKEGSKTTLLQSAKNAITGAVKTTSRKIADTARDLSLIGLTEKQIAIQAERARTFLWEKVVQPGLDKVAIRMQKKDLFANIQKRIEKLNDPVQRNALRDGLDAVAQDYKHIKEWSARTAQDLKSELSQFVPEKMYRGKNVAASATQIRKWMSDEMRAWIRNNVDETVKLAYDDYGNLLTIIERGKNSITKSWQSGGFGKATGALVSKAVTPGLTIGGKVIEKAGQALKSLTK